MRYHPVIMIGGTAFFPGMPRQWGAVAGVLCLHLLVLWWLQVGLTREGEPLITPVTLISVAVDAPAPPVRSEPVPLPARSLPPTRQVVKPDPVPPPTPVAAPAPAAVQLPSAPAVTAVPSEASTPAHSSPTPVAAPAGSRASPQASSSAAPPVVLPTAQAAYLHNPPPAYPVMSRRLAEQGRVMVRVLIGTDGSPQKAELQASSGYDRLDRAALDAVMRWRFVPGRRGDVPETMWVSVPIVFNLE